MVPTRAHVAALAAALAAAAPRPAAAEDGDIAGAYAVEFDEVANNCRGRGMDLGKTSLRLHERGEDELVVRIPDVPAMKGSEGRSGKFKAEVRAEGSAIEGAGGKFSVAGRVRGDGIQLVFIAEYYRGGKPLCTQSWSGTGSAR